MTADTPDEGAPFNLGSLRALLAEFAELPDETPVILQKDGEGNDYSPLAGGEQALYAADSTYSGEVYEMPEEDAEDDGDAEDDDEYGPPEDAVPALVLYPVN